MSYNLYFRNLNLNDFYEEFENTPNEVSHLTLGKRVRECACEGFKSEIKKDKGRLETSI